MFAKNEGPIDRGIRAVLGIVALVAAFTLLNGIWQIIAGVVAFMLLVTAVVGVCPLYSVLRINTCPVKSETRG